MKNYLTQNSKLKKDGIYAFGLPPVKTCPYAGLCKQYCYAQKGFYRMPNVSKAQKERLALTKKATFVDVIDAEIKRRGIKIVRIHDSGDFYSLEYLTRWFAICNLNPEVTFYAYTKSLPYFQTPTDAIFRPRNFMPIFSEGGRFDALINPDRDKHARIFQNSDDLRTAGYVDASKSDLVTINSKQTRIGLIFH